MVPRWETEITWFDRLLGRIGRRYWISRIDFVIREAKQVGAVNSWLQHELDHRLKIEPDRKWASNNDRG